jgi:hypothetical protein
MAQNSRCPWGVRQVKHRSVNRSLNRAINNNKGTGTEQLNDPKWQPPPGPQFAFKFYCTKPQKLILTAANYSQCELEITASDHWQEMVVPAGRLINRFSNQPTKSWMGIGSIHFTPAPGADITKIVFAEFKWVTVHGQIESGQYLQFEGGDSAAVFDENWNKLGDLRVRRAGYRMPSGFFPVSTHSASKASPWLEVQFMTEAEPMAVPLR